MMSAWMNLSFIITLGRYSRYYLPILQGQGRAMAELWDYILGLTSAQGTLLGHIWVTGYLSS